MKPRPMKAKKTAAPRASERQIQKAIFDFLKLALPADAWVGAIPGGDGRATRTPGYVAGTPDLMIVYCGKARFMEVKTATGFCSHAQLDTFNSLRRADAFCTVARSIHDAERLCINWNIPLRASVRASVKARA